MIVEHGAFRINAAPKHLPMHCFSAMACEIEWSKTSKPPKIHKNGRSTLQISKSQPSDSEEHG